MVGNGGETVEADIEGLDHDWPRTMASWATSRSHRDNSVAQRLNLRCLAFLSLLLLISNTSADQVSFDDRCDDSGECPSVASDLKEDVRRAKELEMPEDTSFTYHSGSFDSFLTSLVFGRDTNRHDYFRVTPFDVPESDHLLGNMTHEDGGGGTISHVEVDPTQELETASDPTEANGGDMTQQVPVEIFSNDGSIDGEAVVQGLKQESNDATDGVCEGEDGSIAEEVGWWEKLWVWLALWKFV